VEGGPAVSAREHILGRVRSAAAVGPDREAAVAARLAEHPAGPVPQQARSLGAARLTQFMAKAEAAAATVSRVSALPELPKALAHELRNRNLPQAVRFGAEPLFAGLDWGLIETSRGIGRLEEPATLSRAQFGLAETGTLVLASGPENPVTLTFLGETHFVVLREADLCGGFEDFWAAWRARGLDPRTINMVTGPSRSADIGQVLQLGAHGPVALHVFLLGETPA
jgi:L-lactate utilization protein LutC